MAVSRFSCILSIFIIASYLLTIIIGSFLIKNRNEIPDFESRFGTLTEGLNLPKNSKVAPYWNLIQLLRWLLTSLILVNLADFPLLQVLFIQSLCVTMQLLLISSRPVPFHALSLCNEILISLYLYLMLPLTQDEFMPSGGILSKCLLSTLLFGITVNLSRFIFVSTKQIV